MRHLDLFSWPAVPNLGDVKEIDGHVIRERFGDIDVVTFGSPCQDWSVAGKRAQLAAYQQPDALVPARMLADALAERDQYRRSYDTAKSLLETSEQREDALRARCESLGAALNECSLVHVAYSHRRGAR